MKKVYVNMRHNGKVETVDEFPVNNKEECKEAWRCMYEYNYGDPSHHYYLSSRCTKDWKSS